jgi:hypothetical protein
MDVEKCYTNDNKVNVKLTNVRAIPEFSDIDQNQFVTTQTYALPYLSANLSVSSMTWKEYDNNGTFLRSMDSVENGSIYIANSFIFREMNGFTVAFKNQVNENNKTRVLDKVEFELTGAQPISLPQSVSGAFINSYKKLADNYDSSYLRNLPIAKPKLLIISHSSLTSYIAPLVSWKKSKGFDVYVVNKQDLGNTAISIRNGILAHYNQYKCDFLLLLGDVTGTYAIPTNMYTSPDGTENDADDNFYTMLIGDDYFPEMLSGRFSFGDLIEYGSMANKTIMYEKSPSSFMGNTNWMQRGLVVAGNYAEGGLRPVTPVLMSKWLREKMLSKGYAQVDTVFFPPTLTGASAIQASLNLGVQYVSYRGWGAADGWHYPSFHNQDLNDNIVSGAKMPIVFSIVCNTGDFANSVNPCFGEKWMRMGSPSVPKGCVGFVGPSDLHTKTNLNNTISTGLFSSIFDDGERNMGAAVLAGKIELYKNYPLELASNQHVSFYFHVYNILSDPSMNMWMLVPSTIPETVITNGLTFSPSDSHIQISAPNLNGAYVTGTRDNIEYSYAVVHDGVAILPINPEQTGNLTVTISKENFVPLVRMLTPSQPASIGVTNNSLVGQMVTAGQSYQVTLSVKNYTSATINNVQANLSAYPAEWVTITNPDQTINSIAADASANLTYIFTVNGDVTPHQVIRFALALPSQTTTSYFELLTGGPEFTVIASQGALNIGTNNQVSFTFQNVGTFPIQNATVNIMSRTTAATIVTENVAFGNLGVGETKTIQATIAIEGDCYNGSNIPLTFIVETPAGYRNICYYALTAGNPTAADPTGPCGYKYYAYDSFDIAYPTQKPVYDWIEIDPRDGGPQNAEVHLIMDDDSYTVDLPFSFRYYGVDYNSMTICSNGWASFVTTWMNDFNNLYIPAALGPYAMVAPYWDDLKGMKTGQDTLSSYFNDMRIVNWYDQANNRYIVEWNDAYNNYTIDLMQDASLEKFQMILYPQANRDGDIVFQYHTIDNPAASNNYSTVGIENHLQDDGLTYTFARIYPITATPLQNGLAIKFTTVAPDNHTANNDEYQSVIPFTMLQNYPNPFNPETKISFNLNTKSDVTLEIYNLKGQKIRSLISTNMNKGSHHIVWNGKDDNGTDSGSGVYVYRLQAGNKTQSKKMILLK